MLKKDKIGLSLSGGGYRAAAFHLGTLKKLHEMNILPMVDIISTISGGSIIGGYYALNLKNFQAFEIGLQDALTSKSVIKEVLVSFTFLKTAAIILLGIGLSVYSLFTRYAWLSPLFLFLLITLLLVYQFKIFSVSREIEKAYNKFFFHGATLSSLPDMPVLAIGSTNIQTCRPFTFSKRKMEDSTYAYMNPPVKFRNELFPIARAVMASSSVPFAFTPIEIGREFYENEEDIAKVRPVLVDGGVYDNQGIQKLTEGRSSYRCEIVITSDAGNKLPFQHSYNNTLILLIRTMDVFMARIKNFQMAYNLYNRRRSPDEQIAYLSLGWDIDNCIPGFIKGLADGNISDSVIKAHNIPDEWLGDINLNKQKIVRLLEKNVDFEKINSQKMSPLQLKVARSVGTNLTTLSKLQVDCLSGHAANITELQVKLYCPSLLKKESVS